MNQKSRINLLLLLPLVGICLIGSSCSTSGGATTTEMKLAQYRIVVSPPCSSTPQSHVETTNGPDGKEEILSAQFLCDQTSIVIRRGKLVVNGQNYGDVAVDDKISVRDSQVMVNAQSRSATQN